VYEAKLAVAGFYYFLQGKRRNEILVHWHGDETQNEIDFVNRVLDDTYAKAGALPDARAVSEVTFGDQVYQACMSGRPS